MEEEPGRGRSGAAVVHVDVVPLVVVLGVGVGVGVRRRFWNRTQQNESKEFCSLFHQQLITSVCRHGDERTSFQGF